MTHHDPDGLQQPRDKSEDIESAWAALTQDRVEFTASGADPEKTILQPQSNNSQQWNSDKYLWVDNTAATHTQQKLEWCRETEVLIADLKTVLWEQEAIK